MNATTVKLSVRNWAEEDRPSYKLQNYGAGSLTDAELISLLVGSGTAQYNAVEIANHILCKFDRNLSKLSKAEFYELNEVEGVGSQTICKLMAAMELGKRRQMAGCPMAPDLSTATAIYRYMLPKMQDLKTEEFWVLLCNQNYKLIKPVRISQGGITETSVDIRIIMKQAVLANATIIAAVHNHPSGCIHPSKCDDDLTNSIKKACQLMRIHFSDHVIVCDGQYYSYVERGRL